MPRPSPSAPVTLYTTPTCPDCRQLKSWLTGLGIVFTERDLSDPAVSDEARTRTGVRVAPITVIGDRFFYGTFADQKPALKAALAEAVH